MRRTFCILVLATLGLFMLQGCGVDDANFLGIGAECTTDADCDQDTFLTCLTQFQGGYCAGPGCVMDDDCPEGSICVVAAGGNSCFMTCTQASDCNANRTAANPASCSADIVRAQDGTAMVCVPPSI
jgi:hypothetical protein